MANLIIAPSAENDLNAIVDYISKELCNPEVLHYYHSTQDYLIKLMTGI